AVVDTVKTHVPAALLEVAEGNAGVVLDDERAVGEEEIADRGKAVAVHEIARRLEQADAGTVTLAEGEEGAVAAAVGQVGLEVIERLLLARRTAKIDLHA